MKNDNNYTRRQFLNLTSKLLVSLPMIYTFSCVSKNASLLNSKDSLRKLILLLGPWTNEEKLKAEDFAKSFLKANHATSPYLPGSSKLVQSLANQFPDESMAISEIHLKNLTAEEQKLLVTLTQQLYSFVEVRFDVANEPPWGQCQGSNWHTRTPALDKI